MVNNPRDGRLTSQNLLTGTLNGLEVMYIVSPGNEQFGLSYQVTIDTLASFFAAFPESNTEIVMSGASYAVLPTDTRILVNKTLGSPTTIVFPSANSMLYGGDILVKDIKGDADTNNITLNFGTSNCDGLSTIPIVNAYGWVKVTPIPGSSNWYMSG